MAPFSARNLSATPIYRCYGALSATNISDIRLHGLRHTYASYLARAGQAPATIQRLLGHATPDPALRVYTHVMDEDLAKAALELGDVLDRNSDE